MATSILFNGSIENPKSGIFDILMIGITSLMVSLQVGMPRIELTDNNHAKLVRLWKVTLVLTAIGVILAGVQPDRWGYLSFSFSRETRGEISLWVFLGLHIWSVVLSLVVLYEKNIKGAWVIAWIVPILLLASGSRMWFITTMAPTLVYWLFFRCKNRLVSLFLLLTALFVFWDIIRNVFFLGDFNNSLDVILNGRLPLWLYYLGRFFSHPVFGAGVNSFAGDRYIEIAVSEIGLLKTFSDYGIITGGIRLTGLAVGLYKAIRNLRYYQKRRAARDIDLVATFFFVACFLPSLLDSHCRILTFTDFFAWFSLFYLVQNRFDWENEVSIENKNCVTQANKSVEGSFRVVRYID